jgi:hypothetical protein
MSFRAAKHRFPRSLRALFVPIARSAGALMWPFPPTLFARHVSFQNLMLFLFAYNFVVMVATLTLMKELSSIVHSMGGQPQQPDLSFFQQTVRWTEGLFYYVSWTIANYPLARAFRRRFEADLTLSNNISSLAPFLLFGRPIFWASMAAGLTNDTIVSWLSPIANPPLPVAWATGKEEIRDIFQLLEASYEIFHNVALSVFRAGAITYALFAGARVAGAIGRVLVAYVIGGCLLFSLYTLGSNAGMSSASLAHATRRAQIMKNLQEEQDLARWPIEFLKKTQLIASDYRLHDAARSLAPLQGRLENAANILYREKHSKLLNNSPFFVRVFHLYHRQTRLIPYYCICFGGAWFFLYRLRRKRQWLEE